MGGELDLLRSKGGEDALDFDMYHRLSSWAALISLWALSCSEMLTLSLHRRYR